MEQKLHEWKPSAYLIKYNDEKIRKMPNEELAKKFKEIGISEINHLSCYKLIAFNAYSEESVNKVKNLEWATEVLWITYLSDIQNGR